MSEKTILVIDDSSTIRKLVDTHLSPAGYHVVLAANAEEGLEIAKEILPDLILLDHQLPGTTGYEVCRQLVDTPELCQVPVVVSSTLRKKAYAEYVEMDNVVDMLPKPYTEELLRTTVGNALDTAAMIVTSQAAGTAVPEVIHQTGEAALSGSLACFGIRELLDFLNNGQKTGTLEVEADRVRLRFHLGRGRIQAVYATGLSSEQIEAIAGQLPASLATLAPVLKMTIGGRSCAEVDGFVQLLDQKVLDPRLMSKLLRFQAAMLVRLAFSKKLDAFRFETTPSTNTLHQNLPLEISLLALLVEGELIAGNIQETATEDRRYARVAIRGQNLDRSGLGARHLKLLQSLAEPRSVDELVAALGWQREEVTQVLQAFVQADLVQPQSASSGTPFVVFEPDATRARTLRASLDEADSTHRGKVVRDRLALQLVFKRNPPKHLVFAADVPEVCQLMHQMAERHPEAFARITRIAMIEDPRQMSDDLWQQRLGFVPDIVLPQPCTATDLLEAVQTTKPHQQAPAQQAPAQQAPAQQAPVQQAPVQQAPVQQAPAQQTPAVLVGGKA